MFITPRSSIGNNTRLYLPDSFLPLPSLLSDTHSLYHPSPLYRRAPALPTNQPSPVECTVIPRTPHSSTTRTTLSRECMCYLGFAAGVRGSGCACTGGYGRGAGFLVFLVATDLRQRTYIRTLQ